MNGMVLVAQFLKGGRLSILVTLAFFVFSLTVFILSFAKGTKKSTSTDKVLFAFALLAMILWLVTKNNGIYKKLWEHQSDGFMKD